MSDIGLGFSGITVAGFNGSTADSEGRVKKALFAVTFAERYNDVNVSFTQGAGDWCAIDAYDESIGMRNPVVLSASKYGAVVEFDLDEGYPSDSLLELGKRSPSANWTITDLDTDKPFTPNTLTTVLGTTSNQYGGVVNDEGQTDVVLFAVPFNPPRMNEVDFVINEENGRWAALMPNGEYINLTNPYRIFETKDGATIRFKMDKPYPANAPCILVRRVEDAKWDIVEIDDAHPYEPVTEIRVADYVPAGESVNLLSQTVVLPMSSSARNITWAIKDDAGTGASISRTSYLNTTDANDDKPITLTATIKNGLAIGVDYVQEVKVKAVKNWVNIIQQPELDTVLIAGDIKEFIGVMASTEFGSMSYQWFKSNDGTTNNGIPMTNGTDSSFYIPKNYPAGDYYFYCEIRKGNFTPVKTDVCHVKIVDALRSIRITPRDISVPPGNTATLVVDRNPITSDPTVPVNWYTSDPTTANIEQNADGSCKLISINEGTARITATVGNVGDSIDVVTKYIPVESVDIANFVLETNTPTTMPQSVLPKNATNKDITWSLLDDGGTGASIYNNKLTAYNEGTVQVRATVKGGQTPADDFIQDFTIEVLKKFIPVTNVTYTGTPSPRVGDLTILSGAVTPTNATNNTVRWELVNPSNTGASIENGDVLTCTKSGQLTLRAVVNNGASSTTPYTKEIALTIRPEFIPVDSLLDVPEEILYSDGSGSGYRFYAYVTPEDAENTKITYTIPDNEINQTSGISPTIYNGALRFDVDAISYDDQKTVSVLATVKNGLSDGTDYTNVLNIRIQPKLKGMDEYLPLTRVIFNLPSILRAYRPILISESELRPYDTTQRNARWSIVTIDEATDSQAMIFTYSEDIIDDLKLNGVLLEDDNFVWVDGATYIYPMSGGKLRITLNVPEGISMVKDYESATNRSFAFPDPEDQQGTPVDHEVDDIEILDPFIPVIAINNIPSEIYMGTPYHLSPELDTGDGMDEETARWDDREASYQDVKYEIISGGNFASIDENGVITPLAVGSFRLKITVPSGVQEAYTWSNGIEFNPIADDIRVKEQVDFVTTRSINVKPAYEAETGDVIAKIFTDEEGPAGATIDIPAGNWDVTITKPQDVKVVANDGSGDLTTTDELTVVAPNGSTINAVNVTAPPVEEPDTSPVTVTSEDDVATLKVGAEGDWKLSVNVPTLTKIVDNTGDGDLFTTDSLQIVAPTGSTAVAVNTSIDDDDEEVNPDPVVATAGADNSASLTIPVMGKWSVSTQYPAITKVVDDFGNGDLTSTDEFELFAPEGAAVTAINTSLEVGEEGSTVSAVAGSDNKVVLYMETEGTWNISVAIDDQEVTTTEVDETVTVPALEGATVTATLVEATVIPIVTRVEETSENDLIMMNLPSEGTWEIVVTVSDIEMTVDNAGAGDCATTDDITVPIVSGATVTATIVTVKDTSADQPVTQFSHSVTSGNKAVITLPTEGTWTIDVLVSETSITVEEGEGPRWFDGMAGLIVEVKSEYGQTLTAEMLAGNQLNITSMAEFNLLCTIGDPDESLEIGERWPKRSSIKSIEFTPAFSGRSLNNFGWNFINLESINMIPSSVTSMKNFLRNCKNFNQKVTIPANVNGDNCLNGFLRGCSKFNQPVIIPDGIVGNHCFESFLRDCTSFNKPVFFPSHVEGKCCLYYALAGCTSLNSYVDLPQTIRGDRCMESMLRGCINFNQPVFLPRSISGVYNIAAFMFECRKMTSPIVVPNEAQPDSYKNDVITWATFYRDTPITNGIKMTGANAAVVNSVIGDQGTAGFLPIRTMTVNESPAPTRPSNPYVTD